MVVHTVQATLHTVICMQGQSHYTDRTEIIYLFYIQCSIIMYLFMLAEHDISTGHEAHQVKDDDPTKSNAKHRYKILFFLLL
jgi:hypothetical protein